MEDITRHVEDDPREALIKHWETHLNNSLHAAYVAQQQLDKLYRQRYEKISIGIGHTAVSAQEPIVAHATD